MSTPKEPSLFGSNRFTMPGVIGPEHSINQSQLFVGRTQEKQSLLEHLNKSLTGEQRTVLLYGTSGLGKSELVKSFLREHVIPREGMIVLTGRCHEHESVSFKAFDQIIDTLSHLLMRLTKEDVISVVPQEVAFLTKVFPVLNRVDAINRYTQSVERGEDLPKIRSLAFGALRELFTRLCRLYHVVLFIDDLQWADEDSFLLLRALVAHPSPPALFTILARRTTSEEKDAHNELARVIEGIPAPVDLMPVLPLTNDESLELARRLSELEDIDAQTQGAGLIFMVGESGGHPLFIHELIRHAHNRERQKSGSPFLMLDDALWERISSLPTASRDILEIVSVSGASITIAALAQAANLAPEKLIMTVHQLCVANLLKTAGTDANKLVKPYHDRVRESVLKNLPPRTKRNWHKKLASIYSSLPGMKPDLLAFHYEGAVNLPMARRYLLEAARLADDLLAFDRAAKLYQKVISLWPAQNSHKETGLQEIWRDLGSTLANGGRNREAAHAYLKAVVGANPVEALEYQRLAGDLLMCSGHLDEGQEVINKVMQAHRVRIPKKGWRTLFSLAWRRLLLRLRGLSYRERDASQITTRELMRVDMFRSITSGMFFTDHVKGSELGTRWLHCALNVGEPGRILQALCLEVNFVSSSGKKEGSYQRRLFNTMETLLDKVNKPVHYGLVEVSRSLRHY
ncbi:AAA family ATPase, partial [Myxococcota bacterium]|nr:AAA family ATPase [Myxococcota bacterium]MBU1537415.1 AAA family ATPase [Myxococcota bacterium]